MRLSDLVFLRKTTKAFQPGRQLTTEQSDAIRSLLRMSPSSTNVQPWHFFIASTEAGKRRVASGATGSYVYNEPKIMNASQVVVFCARTRLEEPYLSELLDWEAEEGRLTTEKARANVDSVRKAFVRKHEKSGDVYEWAARQTYIALGFLLLGAAEMGVDACPMEGFDSDALDAELELAEKGLKSLVVVSLGFKADTDFNHKLPKSRLPESAVITEVVS